MLCSRLLPATLDKFLHSVKSPLISKPASKFVKWCFVLFFCSDGACSIDGTGLYTCESGFSILVVLLSFSKYYSTEVSLLLKSLELIIVSGMCLFIIIIIIFPCAYIV